MWFKMGGANLEESATEVAPPVPEIAGQNTIVDGSLGGGIASAPAAVEAGVSIPEVGNNSGTVSAGQENSGVAVTDPGVAQAPSEAAGNDWPARPIVDVNKTIEGVRAASGMDQYIQPQIQTNAEGGTVMGTTVVLPGEKAPPVDPSKIVKRPTGRIPWNSPDHPRFKNAAGGDQAPTTEQDGAGSDNGQVGETNAEDVTGGAASSQVEVLSGTGGDGLPGQVEGQIVGGAPAAEIVVPKGAELESGQQPAEAVVDSDAQKTATVEGDVAEPAAAPVAIEDAPLGVRPDGQPWSPGEAIAAPPGPRPLTPEEERDKELDEMDKKQEEDLRQRGWDTAVSPDAGTPPADPDLAAALNSDTNPNAQDRIVPSGFAQANSVLSPAAEDQLRADGVIAPDADGTDVINAVGQPSAVEEVVPSTVEEPVETPEAPADEVVSDAPATGEPETEAAEPVTAPSSTVDGEVQVDNASGGAATEVPAPAGGLPEGDVIADDSVETPAAEVVSPEEPVQPAAEPTDQTSTDVVEGLMKPAEESMSMDLAAVEDRIAKVPAEKRATQIKFEVARAIRDKMEQDNITSLSGLFGFVEEYNRKIAEMQNWLEFMTANSRLVEDVENFDAKTSTLPTSTD